MRKGSVVKLTRPWQSDTAYRDKCGIIERIKCSESDPVDEHILGDVRFENRDESLNHIVLHIYLHRVDVIEE